MNSQKSTSDQLNELIELANKNGLYDAADYVKARIGSPAPRADERTEAELIKEAQMVQDACNLSGVVQSFARSIARLWSLSQDKGGFSTSDINQHQVCRLFADKIKSLAGETTWSDFG